MTSLTNVAFFFLIQIFILLKFTEYNVHYYQPTQCECVLAPYKGDAKMHLKTDVFYWLQSSYLHRYAKRFYDHGVHTLVDVSTKLNETLLDSMNITRLTHRMTLLSRSFIMVEKLRSLYTPRKSLASLLNLTDIFYRDIRQNIDHTKAAKLKRKKYIDKKREIVHPKGHGQYDITVVTAFFADPMAHLVQSKHPTRHFLEWFITLLEFPSSFAMRIYTDERHFDEIVALRAKLPNRTSVVAMKLADSYVARRYGLDAWHETWYQDRECSRHTWPLYMIWSEKSRLVLNTARENPFGSLHFFWMDIGYVRRRWARTSLIQFPFLPRVKVASANGTKNIATILNPFATADIQAMQDDPPLGRVVFHTKLLANCFGGGGLRVWEEWNEVFYSTLDMFRSRNWFFGKDQIVMNTAYLRRPELWTMMTPHKNDYFFLLAEMSNRTSRSNSNFMNREYHPVIGHRWANDNKVH